MSVKQLSIFIIIGIFLFSFKLCFIANTFFLERSPNMYRPRNLKGFITLKRNLIPRWHIKNKRRIKRKGGEDIPIVSRNPFRNLRFDSYPAFCRGKGGVHVSLRLLLSLLTAVKIIRKHPFQHWNHVTCNGWIESTYSLFEANSF